jgi:hypothetical protein
MMIFLVEDPKPTLYQCVKMCVYLLKHEPSMYTQRPFELHNAVSGPS